MALDRVNVEWVLKKGTPHLDLMIIYILLNLLVQLYALLKDIRARWVGVAQLIV